MSAAVLSFPRQPRIGSAPSWAKAVIVAELHESENDIQTDYFGHRTTRVVALAWSKHTRDLFPELRKAADTFTPASHLGTGRGVFQVLVTVEIHQRDLYYPGGCLFRGCGSPWHRDIVTFTSRALAEAYAAAADPIPEHVVGDQVVRFVHTVREEKIEHREKYSMGSGYYLSAAGHHGSGWVVRKRTDIDRVVREAE